ncbi:MAG: hypothetical protein HRT71_04110 [Flavobacteriales bacterium]|nr:hypothetical protein [Flavobacteriales bacterium]
MNSTEKLVIQLIVHDMKHQQLVIGLSGLGFDDTGRNCLGVFENIIMWLPIEGDELIGECLKAYMGYMKKASKMELTETNEQFEALAKECYGLFVACVAMQEKQDE